MTTDKPSARQKISLLAAALLVSVILNLFLVGVLAGIVPVAHSRHFGLMALSSRHGEYMDEWLLRSLAPADAEVLRAVLQPEADALKQAHEHVRQAVRETAAIFEQDPPDPGALQAAVEKVQKAKAEVNDAVGAVIENAYTKLSPEGRKRLAEMTR